MRNICEQSINETSQPAERTAPMRPMPRDRQFRQRLTDALGVLSLFVLLGAALHLPY